MVNVFGDSIAGGPGNLQVAKKVVDTVGQYYIDPIRQSYELGFLHYRLHTNVEGVLVTSIVRRCMYWTMLLRWRLAIARLQRTQ